MISDVPPPLIAGDGCTCGFCGKICGRKSDLTKHLRSHPGGLEYASRFFFDVSCANIPSLPLWRKCFFDNAEHVCVYVCMCVCVYVGVYEYV